MPFLNSIVSWLTTKRMHQIELFKKHPVEVQNETLYELIRAAKNTEWGKQFHYRDIRPGYLQRFAEQVPISDYEDVKPYINRLRNGETNLLWPTEIKWFSKSSGTTSDKSKFIPVSYEALEDCHYKGGKDVIALYNAAYPDNQVLKGKTLALGGSHQIDNFSNNSYFGDVSAILIQNMPFWAQIRRTPDRSIALMDEWESKLELMARETLKDNVTSLAGVPSWTMVLLKRILEISGAEHIHEVWPSLEVFIHGGVSFVPYREQYNKIIDRSKMHYLETYNASEGFFAMQDDPTTDDMLLMLDYGIYYEFIPMDELGKEHPKALSLAEVELGVNYAIVITTNAGLWRYMIGDTVTFTSKYPFKIKVSGRTKHFINAFGEEVIVDNAEKALDAACTATGAMVKEYTAAPVFMHDDEQGAHEWIIEFEKMPNSIDAFKLHLDKKLQQINSDYEAKRYKNKVLREPTIHVAQQGLFYNWLKVRGKLGGQHKVPRLANHRDYVDGLLKIMSNHTKLV